MQGAEIGSVYHSSTTINHDRIISIPGFTSYGYDSRKSHPCPKMVAELGLKVGILHINEIIAPKYYAYGLDCMLCWAFSHN
jgi:hypothetical protein